jgi:organic radical activating enzyme
MKKLRLLLFEDCDRNCKGCCNKQWDLKRLPVCTTYKGYDQIILTGGEPMLNPNLINKVIDQIRSANKSCKIILYTAKVDNYEVMYQLIEKLDGITVTLHEAMDIASFNRFNDYIYCKNVNGKSLRLNVFREVGPIQIYMLWETKKNIEWIEDCPLPKDEIFMRFN